MRDQGGGAIAPADALEALTSLTERQRALRRAYVAARYGWPETPAVAWGRRPETFADGEPAWQPSRYLE